MREPIKSHVVSLEKDLANVTSTINELSDQVDNMIHKNVKIAKVIKSMIKEFGKTIRGELRSLA